MLRKKGAREPPSQDPVKRDKHFWVKVVTLTFFVLEIIGLSVFFSVRLLMQL